jgi:hypothetical protein
VFRAFGQDQQVQGIVFDKDTKQRLAKVYLYNTRTHQGFYNNLKGEFTTTGRKGDTLVLAVENYLVDTVTVKSQQTLIVYLKRTSILLKEVKITDSARTPKAILEQNQKDYKSIYRIGNNKDLLTLGGANGIGAGLSIDALYSLFSKEGKNARFLQKIIERDYREAMIDYRFTKTLVNQATGLQGDKLDDFMGQFRPSYYFILEASDYALISYIREGYQQYLKNPRTNRLPVLTRPGGN